MHNSCCDKTAFPLINLSDTSELMVEDRQNMTLEELVDILAQKTEKFTQLLAYKDFGNEYKECKHAIKQIITEIETRKQTTLANQMKATSA